MGITNDGKAKKDRKRDKGNSSDQRDGLGSVRGSSSVDGIEPIRVAATDSPGESTSGATVVWDGESPTGKILERLELLEKAFRTYVGGHQHRLEARLGESKEFEASFTEEVQIIKQEIYNLAANPKEPE
ncbi:hypothetical protein CDG77_13980 [Nostoc sp. 'Peltigera membranacea cyanobiont' 213]|uniref:hypothetical protein n=1 Tax=Nostoc sp. 'Peltigera membranacea cyanobiont' 213 TaxID=2014530 RepID=UPI000B95203F|nr:hypothetical protein [Nostoc sp. 'Peltigera membranacea cyanobiont' 213]OYD92759.1 hypothetical protein CDG77_13980 [Nostoc sp. 'Peltigera membranacea cyanobiont' 213]